MGKNKNYYSPEKEIKRHISFYNFYDFDADKNNYKYIQIQNTLLNKTVESLSERIKRYLDKNYYNKNRNYTYTAKCLAQIEDERKIAFITVKSIFSCLHRNSTQQKAAKTIAIALNNENICLQFLKKNEKRYKEIVKEYSSRNARTYTFLKALSLNFTKQEGFIPTQWNESQKMHVGQDLLEMFEDYGFFERRYPYKNKRRCCYIIPSVKMIELAENINPNSDFFCSLEPVLYIPVKWNSTYNGGFDDEYIDSFVRKASDKYLSRAEKHGLEKYFDAVNITQSVPWQINKELLCTAEMIMQNNIEIGGIPANREIKAIENPHPYDPDKRLTPEELKEVELWKQQNAQQIKETIKNRSKRFLIARIVKIAQKYKDEVFYFPHNIDFRGRMYPMCTELHPQGCDLSKALLRFKEGKTLDENGVKWLKIHIANMYGLSKKSYNDRINWVHDNISDIFRYTENPLVHTNWTMADKPFQFLAGCFELLNYLKDPYKFKSTLPIFTDGTCNGLQHYSALLRDEVGGASVNLVPNNKPSDIYQEIADCLKEKLKNLENERLAELWLELGIERDLTKKPVMTLVYGAVKYSCKEYIKTYLMDNYTAEYLHQHFEEIGSTPYRTINIAANRLGELLWETIEECIPSAIKTMEYIRNVTKIAAKKEKDIEWVTPMNMLISQNYKCYKYSKICTQIMGRSRYLTYRKETPKINKRKHTNAICPNFIHSLDASCLMLWILRCSENNIKQLTSVHDSYGVLANDMEQSQRILRECFVDIYQEYDVLKDFIDDITANLTDEEKQKLPAPPKYGSLNLELIKDSAYFFS